MVIAEVTVIRVRAINVYGLMGCFVIVAAQAEQSRGLYTVLVILYIIICNNTGWFIKFDFTYTEF